MSKRETIKTLLWGAVGGAILTIAFGFGSGWLVASSTRDTDVEAAWIDAQAAVCSSLVQSHRLTTGDLADLSGYQARTARDELAQMFAVALPGTDTASPAVVRACAKMLDQSQT